MSDWPLTGWPLFVLILAVIFTCRGEDGSFIFGKVARTAILLFVLWLLSPAIAAFLR